VKHDKMLYDKERYELLLNLKSLNNSNKKQKSEIEEL
jgi:hypothetical protein